MALFLISFLVLQPGYEIYGLEGGSLEFRETGTGDMGYIEYDIAVYIDGEPASTWVSFPLYFNPAKTFAEYSADDGTLEVISQFPFSANYTYAWYRVGPEWDLTLFDEGEGDYYGSAVSAIEGYLEEGDLRAACARGMEVMYPGAMPYPDRICSKLVIAAAAEGTLDAFRLAEEVAYNLAGKPIHELESDSPDYFAALKLYEDLADPGVAALVRERIESNE